MSERDREFDDEHTPLPPAAPAQRDPLFPTGRQPAIDPDKPVTSRMWTLRGGTDTVRMSALELSALFPMRVVDADDPAATTRVEAAQFRPVARPSLRALFERHAVLIAAVSSAFAAGLTLGVLIG